VPCVACCEELVPAPALPPPPGLDACAALLAYEGVGRALVTSLKYERARAALRGLALAMAALVDPASVDLVTWAPTTAARRRERGFDQAELLARRVAPALGRPCHPLLRRGWGPPQTGRSRVQRRGDPPALVARRRLAGHRVVVVDDVVTTGATATAAARALRLAGAGEVVLLAAARTAPGAAVTTRCRP